MPKQKTFDYPQLSVEACMRAVRILIEKLDGETENSDSFASMLGHKSANTGAFISKLADLRRYNLLEPRGDIRATDLAQRLVHPKDSQEKQEALNEMVMSIELWRKLYSKIGTNYSEDDFWIYLMEVTEADRNEAKKEAETVSKKYKADMSYYRPQEEIERQGNAEEDSRESNDSDELNSSRSSSVPKITEEMVEAKAGSVYICLPKNKKSLETAKKLLEVLSFQVEDSSD